MYFCRRVFDEGTRLFELFMPLKMGEKRQYTMN